MVACPMVTSHIAAATALQSQVGQHSWAAPAAATLEGIFALAGLEATLLQALEELSPADTTTLISMVPHLNFAYVRLHVSCRRLHSDYQAPSTVSGRSQEFLFNWVNS